ncbi:MAG: hypothetical protein HDQ88_04225 [Clostridia bacterium]|nr:hypothetical protein [Clostridia bacterium]
MILTKEDYGILSQIQILLAQIMKNAVMSEIEEEHEREFEKLIDLNGKKHVQEIVSKTLEQEVKEMMIELEIPGSVRKRKNGLIEARTLYFGSVYGRTKEELNRKLSAKITELIVPAAVKDKRQLPLFSEFCNNSYIPYKKSRKTVAENTLKGYKYRLSVIARENFDKRINLYSPQKIEAFLLSIEKTRTRQLMQGFMNNVFGRAVAEGLIKNNPCAPIEKMEHAGNIGTAFSFDEQKKFFTTLFSSNLRYIYKCYFVFVYLTGTRRSEALASVTSDLNRSDKILQINGTKTDGSFRFMPVLPLVEKLLLSMPMPSIPLANIFRFRRKPRTGNLRT